MPCATCRLTDKAVMPPSPNRQPCPDAKVVSGQPAPSARSLAGLGMARMVLLSAVPSRQVSPDWGPVIG